MSQSVGLHCKNDTVQHEVMGLRAQPTRPSACRSSVASGVQAGKCCGWTSSLDSAES